MSEEIKKLKKVGRMEPDPNLKKKAIDALAAYGNSEAILAIVEIVDAAGNPEVKEYGLEVIKRIKEGKIKGGVREK